MSRHVKRRSTVDELPKELLEEVHALMLEPKTTYEDVREYVGQKGFDLSRSAIGRYGRLFLEQYAQLKRLEDQARAIRSEPGEGMLLDEALSKLLLQKILQAVISGELDVTTAPKVISEITRLQQTNINREKLKADLSEKMRSVADTAEELAKEKGLPDDAAKDIRERLVSEVDSILGI